MIHENGKLKQLYSVEGQTIFPVYDAEYKFIGKYVQIYWDGKNESSMERVEIPQPPIGGAQLTVRRYFSGSTKF